MQTQREVLLEMFKDANPNLVALSSKIIVDKILESSSSENSEIVTHNAPLLRLTVKHPFIYDNRLVPTQFQGIEVKNITTGKFPSEFPEPLTEMPLEEYHNPKRYIAFVKRKLSAIRKKLKKPHLSEQEALDALTGGWRKHIEWCKQLTKKRLAEMD